MYSISVSELNHDEYMFVVKGMTHKIEIDAEDKTEDYLVDYVESKLAITSTITKMLEHLHNKQ